MRNRKLTSIAVLAIIVAATYLATSQPIGPVGLGRVSHDSTMTGSGTTANPLGVSTSTIQSRITGTCTSPNAIRVVNSDGTVTCTTGVLDTAGSGLAQSGSTVYANMGGATCANGSAVTAISGSGVGTCTVVSTMTGVGDIQGVTAGSGLTGGGTSGTVTVAVNAGSGITADGANARANLGNGLTFSTGAITINAGSGLTVDATNARANIGTGLTFSAGAITANLAGASCGAGSAMTALGATGTGTCTGLISGTSGRSTRFSSATAIGNGGWTDDGTNVTSVGTVSTVSTTTLGDDKGDVITFFNGPTGINRYAGIHKEWTEEFLSSGAIAANTPIGEGLFVWAGSTATFTANPSSGRFGVHALDTALGTASSTYVRFFTSPFLDLGSTTTVSAYLTSMFDTLSSSSNAVASMYYARWGLTDETSSSSSSDVTNGCYLMYDKGNTATGNKNPTNLDRWECACAAGGTRTIYLINSTGNSDESFALGDGTIAAATWYRWRIKITTTSGTPTRAEFYKVAQDDVETKVCDINTNMPTSLTLLGLNVTLLPKASTGTGSRKWNLDQATFSFDAAASRNP